MPNLFASIYPSDSANFVSSGYVCETAANADGNSFSISDSEAVIQDSNGDTLSSVDLSSIISKPVYEWETQNKILQANTSYILEGLSYGLSYESLYFYIPTELTNIESYNEYCNVEFDLTWTINYQEKDVHIDTTNYKMTDIYGNRKSCWDLVQKIINELNVPITVSIEEVENDIEIDGISEHYEVKFTSTALGFAFIIRNLRVNPIIASEDYPNSPFVKASIKVQDVLDSIIAIKPYPINPEDPDNPIDSSEGQYEVDCNLYVYILDHAEEGLENLDNPNDSVYKYPNYDYKDVYNVFYHLKESTGLSYLEDNGELVYKLPLIISKIVYPIKYPNGAMKGIVIIPIWPSSVDSQVLSLRYTFVKDFITEYVPIQVKYSALNSSDENSDWVTGYEDSSVIVFQREDKEVRIGTKIDQELSSKADKSKIYRLTKNNVISTNYDNEWISGRTPTEDFFVFHENIEDIPEDETWNGPEDDLFYRDTHKSHPKESIGIYKFLEYITKENLWNSFSQGLMIISNPDSENSNEKNQIPSMIIKNPNDFPVQIKYMVFN